MTRYLSLLIIIPTVLLGCAGGNNYRATAALPGANFQTFVWAQPAMDATMPHALHSPLLDGVMQAATVRALEKHGLTSAAPGKADLIVTYHALRLPAVPGARFRVGPYGLGVYGPDFTEKYYLSGNTLIFHVGGASDAVTMNADYYLHVLVVDILDARTGKLIWRGWQQAQSDDDLLTLGKVPDTVYNILRDFAPNPMQLAQANTAL